MNQKHTSTEPYLTLEDGEYQVTSDDGGIEVDRESALGLTTVRLRADYAAAPALLDAVNDMLAWARREGLNMSGHPQSGWNECQRAGRAIALATGEAERCPDCCRLSAGGRLCLECAEYRAALADATRDWSNV